MPKTNYANNKIQAALYGAAALGAPATWYVAWSTTAPNQDGSNITEPVGNGYARVAVTSNTTNFPAPIDNGPSGTTTWASSTAYALNATVFPTSKNGYYYKATAVTGTGTSGSSQPTWPTTVGATVVDNSGANQITWTCFAAQGKQSQNGTAISWPQSSGSQGTPNSICLFDAATGGNCWEYETISPAASAVNANTIFQLPANNLSMYNN